MSRSLVMGNWKMNGSITENKDLLEQLTAITIADDVDVGVAVPYVYLDQVSQLLEGSAIKLVAQDISTYNKGAYTGEISGAMLQEFGCDYVLVGHSERREYHQETNTLVAQKVRVALKKQIIPIICIGETLEQREAGATLSIVGDQLISVIDLVGIDALQDAIIAYEPVWAIGTGLTATPDQAQEVHRFIRSQLGQQSGNIKILYGGSVSAKNAAELFAQKDIDGGLVGGASLKPVDFIHIIQQA